MIRPSSAGPQGLIASLKRRQFLRIAFLTGILGASAELAMLLVPVLRVNKIVGLGVPVPVGPKAEILAKFAATNDEPIRRTDGRFFLLHAPGGIAAVYWKCTHLGCTVPWIGAEDQFHCPCHGSLYEKRTGIVQGGLAPRPLDLFHIREDAAGALVVDTNPLNLLVRKGNDWDPAHLEVKE